MTAKKTKVGTTVENSNMVKMGVFDLSGLDPRFDFDTSTLSLSIPAFMLNGPALSPEMFQALQTSGLEDYEVDMIMENMFRSIDKLLFVKAFSDRML